MKKLLLAAIGFVAMGMAAPAIAADMPIAYGKTPTIYAALYDWSGLYIGVNGGWGSSRKCWDQNTGIGGPFLASEGCHDATGGVAGGQAGFRWQTSSFVFGIELQGDWANLRGSNISLFTPAVVDQSRIGAFGLATAQVGYAFDTALIYVKGGGAAVQDRYRGYAQATGAFIDGASEVRGGGVVGAGVEYAFIPNWSAALEYDHLFLGNKTKDFFTLGGAFTREDRIRQDADLVTVRVNYRWGGPVIAKY